MAMPPTFVCYEDRLTDQIGLKLLVASFLRNGPDARLICYCPGNFEDWRSWASGKPNLDIRDSESLGVTGWDVKPTALLTLLDEGHEKVVWLDADLIFARRCGVGLFDPAGDTFGTTQENQCVAGQDADRSAAWGFTRERKLIGPVNSCIVGVTAAHRPLLRAWAEMLRSNDYRKAQKVPYFERPLHLMSDQDLLDALLGSSEFARIPVRRLRAGIDIAQCWFISGFAPRHRLRALIAGLPPIIHCPGAKPWRDEAQNALTSLALGVSTYSLIARRFQLAVNDPVAWAYARARSARILIALGLGSPVLPGLYLQAIVALYRLMLNLRRTPNATGRP